MTWLFEKLTGPWGYVLAALNAALVAAWVSWEGRGLVDARDVLQANLANMTAQKRMETDRADGNAKTVTAITSSVSAALAENGYLTGQALKRYQATVALNERLSHVPKTVACAGSPAIRELLRAPSGAAGTRAGGPH